MPHHPLTEEARAISVVTAQVPIGGDGEEPTLKFTIQKIYPGEKPIPQAPWHQAGGEWTWFDARTAGGAAFTVGVKAKKPSGDLPIGFGDAAVIPASREAGTKLVEELAQAFHAGAPPAPGAAEPLKPAQLRLAVLGYDTSCTSGQGCGGDGT